VKPHDELAFGCNRLTAPDTCPHVGRQREPESLAPRSSAAFIIATVSASLREPLRRWKSVPLELGWSYCAPHPAELDAARAKARELRWPRTGARPANVAPR